MASIDSIIPNSLQVPNDRSELDNWSDDIENSFGHRFVPRLNLDANEQGPAPDGNLFANTYVKLSHGITAYYVIDPPHSPLSNQNGISCSDIPVILCLHGLTNSSYMFRDLAEQLAANTSSQVIAFDFYGRGRSPWTGVKCSLETFVSQATELLEYLNIKTVSCLIGYDIGAAVAAGLMTRFNTTIPRRFSKLCLLSPVGLIDDRYCISNSSSSHNISMDIIKLPIIGEICIKMVSKSSFVASEVANNYCQSGVDMYHYPVICKANRMLEYQLDYTPGFRGAYLSTLRHFPFDKLSRLYSDIGRQCQTVTSVCTIIGKCDALLPVMSEEKTEHKINNIFNCHYENPGRNPIALLAATSGKWNDSGVSGGIGIGSEVTIDRLGSNYQQPQDTQVNKFALSRVVCLENCGHHVLFERFDETVEVLIQYINNIDCR